MAPLAEMELTATARDTGTGWEHTLYLDGKVVEGRRAACRLHYVLAAMWAGRVIARSWHRSEALATTARAQHGSGRIIPIEIEATP